MFISLYSEGCGVGILDVVTWPVFIFVVTSNRPVLGKLNPYLDSGKVKPAINP